MTLNGKTKPRRRKHATRAGSAGSPKPTSHSRTSSHSSQTGNVDSEAEESETEPRSKRIAQAIANVDLTELKKLARTGAGLQTIRNRRRAWPLLLNFRSLTESLWEEGRENEDEDEEAAHPDESQVALDVVRTSLPKSTEYRKDEAATKKRQEQLGTVVCSVLRKYRWLGYYQGFHELALTFLCVFGSERPATEAAKMVALFFVRDAMSSNLDNVLVQLRLLYVVLRVVSPEVHALLSELDVPPFFAISWVLTWFAHDIDSFDDICRIYDFLIVSPPLQVVYMAAALIKRNEAAVLGCDRDFAIVHTTLSQLPRTVDGSGGNQWRHIIADSYCLERDYPATKLQHMGTCHLPKLSVVNSFEATWRRLDPAQPRPFVGLVPILNGCHPLVSEPEPAAGARAADGSNRRTGANRMAKVIDLTNTAQKARDLALQHRWPLLIATVASATMAMYAWMLVQQFQMPP
ncbi:GTPase-activating protein gyp8 [Coemansia sp. RSA 1939]|nr:GTPase-activating protein gyp8 [Coemansia sp. RSA 1939]KAJ2605650.1 GTPase-activating protein gyp8 [Coemansia sp. RSA 1804]